MFLGIIGVPGKWAGSLENTCEGVWFIEENLEMESKDITIERAHRTGSKINGKKRAIITKFLNYKDKDAILNQYRQKQL